MSVLRQEGALDEAGDSDGATPSRIPADAEWETICDTIVLPFSLEAQANDLD
ncbi:hypothetical protein [Corynebacterium belfantii]|uniref:hypothetical protein n=1 Tax=Corynebacterium belfantii TaxID=2014537 RepID=UPI0028B0E617|nr:hypothetical protein [Corynebacterium belfantii]